MGRFCSLRIHIKGRNVHGKITEASLWDDPHKMTTLKEKRASTNDYMHVHMPIQAHTHMCVHTHTHVHLPWHYTELLYCVLIWLIQKNSGLVRCCTKSSNRVAKGCKVLPADLGQLTLKKWWFPQSILSPWCKGILSVTGRPLTYDRAFARGSMNSPPSSITITQCSGWIPSPESWMSCSRGASRPPTKVRSCTHKKQNQKSACVAEMKF